MSYERFRTPTSTDTTTQPTKRLAAAAAPVPAHSTVLNFDQDDDEDNEATQVNQALLRESGHIGRSEHMLDEQFDLAIKTRQTLIEQRHSIKSMQSQYNSITERFQTIGTLIRKIRLRKRRDTMIVGVVFGICLFFLMYHIFA